MFQRTQRVPAAMAPTPTMANWPSEMLPPQPVSTASDTATRHQTTAKHERDHRRRGEREGVQQQEPATEHEKTPRRPSNLGRLPQLSGDRLEHARRVPGALAGLGPGAVLAVEEQRRRG